MSYAEQVRGELSRLHAVNRCCHRSELAALIWAAGVWTGDRLVIYADSAALARRLFSFFKEQFGLRPVATRVRRPGRGKSYRLEVPGFGQDANLSYRALAQHHIKERRCCRKAYLRGFFLGRGSVNDPGRGHHLELTTRHGEAAGLLIQLMKGFGLMAATVRRKRDYVIYLKDAESIVTFLNLIGAHNSLMQFENVRVYKDLKGRVNRLVNMETANLGRTVQASVQQLDAIEVIDERLGLHRLPPSLSAVAWARQQHPELSLEELGMSMTPPLTKSAVNHRLRRLVALARKLQGETERGKGGSPSKRARE